MTANETAALAALWQPVAQIIVDQLTDYFGARLRMAEAVVYTGPWPRLRRQMPAHALAANLRLEGAQEGALTVVWAVSETAQAEIDEVRAAFLEAVAAGLSAGADVQTIVHMVGEPWPIAEEAPQVDTSREETLLAWEAAGDGVEVFLGFVLPEAAAGTVEVGHESEPIKVATRAPRLPKLRHEPVQGAARDLDLILDLPLKLTVEIGSARLLIKDVLNLGKGSVVELNRVAGEPVDILINGKQLAKGEVVVLPDGNFGVRVVEISGSQERLRTIREE